MTGPPDDIEREAWDRAWRSRPHRRLSGPPKIGLDEALIESFGNPVSTTISQDPPEFADRVLRESEHCPICGGSTVGTDRIGATLNPKWERGMTLGIGVWVHRYCFDLCPDSDEPAPIPW